MYFGYYYENWKQIFHGNHDNVQGCLDMKLYVTKMQLNDFWSQNEGLGFCASQILLLEVGISLIQQYIYSVYTQQ